MNTKDDTMTVNPNGHQTDVMVSLIGKSVKYNGVKYTVTDYFNYTDLIMLDDEITISRIHTDIEWLN